MKKPDSFYFPYRVYCQIMKRSRIIFLKAFRRFASGLSILPRRLGFVGIATVLLGSAALCPIEEKETTRAEKVTVPSAPLKLGKGPYFFFDDRLVAGKEGMELRVHSPKKCGENPIVPSQNPLTVLDLPTGAATVLADKAGGGFRMWYVLYKRGLPGTHLGFAVSDDGIGWRFPNLGIVEFEGNRNNNLLLPQVLGGRVLVDPDSARPSEKYKAILYRHQPDPVGFSTAFSPDGIHWGPPFWIEELDDRSKEGIQGQGASDVVNAFYDQVRGEWVAVFKMWSLPGQYQVAVKRGIDAPRCGRRVIGSSRSKDFRHWTKAKQILLPDDQDPATLEFYGMQAVIRRGDWYIGFVPCLIDDAPPDGIGWTELAVSLDGDRWQRIRQRFLDRSADDADAPDHAIAWVSEVFPVEGRNYVYYSALRYGHKIGDRSGCLAFLEKDRFMSLEAISGGGRMSTKRVLLPRDEEASLRLNVDASKGKVRVQFSDGKKALRGYSFSDCDPVTVDSVSIPVRWRGKSGLPKSERPLKIEFRVDNARLYAFEF